MFSQRTNWNLAPNRLSEALARHRAAGKKLLDLSASNPTECGFQYDSHAIMRALCSPAAMEYHPQAQGLPVARRAVAAYYEERGIHLSTEQILLTASTSEAYSFVFRLLCDAGDELLVPAPSYPLLDFLAEVHDVKLKRYPLIYDHGWQIDFHALEQLIGDRTRGIIVVHPNNPTGHYTKMEELAELNQRCAEKRLAIIADEVFLDFSLVPRVPLSFSANAHVLTFTMSGLSKISGLPQMKLAWLAVNGPDGLRADALARLEVLGDTYLSASTPIQLAAPALLALRYEVQKQLMARMKENFTELDRQLSMQKHCGRLNVEGGWYAVLRVPATRSDEELALELLEKKDVYVHPGHFYDFHGEGYLVVSLIAREAEFAEGIRRILEFP